MDELRKLADEWELCAEDSAAAGAPMEAAVYRECAAGLRKALAAIHAGWVLVPVEPTGAMIRAFADAPSHMDCGEELRLAWIAMLNASPPLAASRADGEN